MVIGITGASGSGKTTVSNLLQSKLSCSIINSDEIVHTLSQKGMPYYTAIVDTFGTQILDEIGNIDKKSFGNLIFSNSKMRHKLNDLTFKYVVEEIKNQISKFSLDEIIILDAPLLFESNLDNICDVTIAIIADKKNKVKRIIERDFIEKESALNRLKSQKSDSFFRKNADYIIINNGNLLDLVSQMESILVEIF